MATAHALNDNKSISKKRQTLEIELPDKDQKLSIKPLDDQKVLKLFSDCVNFRIWVVFYDFVMLQILIMYGVNLAINFVLLIILFDLLNQ